MAGIVQTEKTGRFGGDTLETRWSALHEAGQEIGALAALAPEPFAGALADFPQRVEARGGAHLALAQEGITDLDAMLQPGLLALRNIHARGQDTTAPALALWREFHALRQALLDIALPHAVEEEPVSA